MGKPSRFELEGGNGRLQRLDRVTEFIRGPREQAPISKGGSGVPPDLMTSLLAGPLGFAGLAERHPDMNAGSQQELMNVLFPPLTLDVQTWVVP